MTTNHDALREALEAIMYRIEHDLEHDHEWAVVEREIAHEALAASKPDHLRPGCEGNPAPENNPCAVCGTSKPEHEYHFIGYVDGYGREIKDKDARMKLPRAVYFRAERSMK